MECPPYFSPRSLISLADLMLEVLRSQHTVYIEEELEHVYFVEEKLFQIAWLKATLMIKKIDSEDIRGISSYQAR